VRWPFPDTAVRKRTAQRVVEILSPLHFSDLEVRKFGTRNAMN
jgi:hypothetical protein